MEYLPAAIDLVANFEVLMAIVIGTIFGGIVGALPGLGVVVGLVVVLPFTLNMSTAGSMALLLSIYCSSVYGGSLSAILINTPGTPNSAATIFDGYPMAKRGEADKAIGWATFASTFGGILSLIILIIAAPQLARFAVLFGPAETFALIIFALICISRVSQGSQLMGVLGGVIGLFLASIGPDTMTGVTRFGFGIDLLSGGFSLISILIGLFALAEVFYRSAYYTKDKPPDVSGVGFKLPKWTEVVIRIPQLLKSSFIGIGIGILPGMGGAIATFISYAEIKRTSPRKENFGKGEPDGIIASEAANNATTGGTLIPTMALGIPGDGATVVLLGAMLIQGVVPGVQLFQNNPDILVAMFLILFGANLLIMAIGAVSARCFHFILKLPEPLIMGFVLLMSLVGAFVGRGNPLDVVVAVVAGIVGAVMRFIGIPLAPIVIGMALGKTLEEALRQGLIFYDGNFFMFFKQPIAVFLFLLSIVVIGMQIKKGIAK